MNEELKIAVASDIHLGHRLTPTVDIIRNLENAFPDNGVTGELDIIFLSGDVFDRMLNLPDDNVSEIRFWINRFLRMCSRRDIVVRVLEGTPSHDWGQSKLFDIVKEIGEISVDLKYHDKLSIEYIERFGINVLYVPDEWEHETDDTWMQVKELLREHGLEQVDYSIMHGCFSYQLPEHLNVPMHQEDRYLSITKQYVFIGHHHRHTTYERIIVPGSFDRLSHGEEEDKGHVELTVRAYGDDNLRFVKNGGAKRYDTVNCEGLEVDEAILKIEKKCQSLPKESAIRVMATKSDAVIDSLETLKSQYPDFTWSSKISTKTDSKDDTLQDLRSRFRGVDITRDNIVGLLMERIGQRVDDTALLKRCGELLEEAVA